MIWVTYSIQWIHEFLGIFWFGGVLYLNFVVIPAITRQPLENQRQISGTLSKLSDRVFKPISLLVIVFGILRGRSGGQSKPGISCLAAAMAGRLLWRC